MILRRANNADADIILKWRNDDSTRANSFSTEIIKWEDHIKWFEKKLGDENCLMLIAEDAGRAVGSIRLDMFGNIGEISYMIAPEERGQGYGREILKLLEKELPQRVKVLTGIVRKSNQPSVKCFSNNCYTMLEAEDTVFFVKTV